MINLGEIDFANSEIRYSEGADEVIIDEELERAMTKRVASPFTGVYTPTIPDAYLLMVRIQNNSDIRDDFGGFQMPIQPIGLYIDPNGVGFGMYAPNADDGSGVFPESININDLWQKDRLNAEGSAYSTLSTPTVDNEKKSFGSVKAMFR